jgi:transketolase
MIQEKEKIIESLQLKAENIRRKTIDIIFSAKAGHTGGSLSSIEIETVLYFYVMNINPKNPSDENRDRFILSKGHSVEALYSTLSTAGFFPEQLLETYGKFGSPLTGHPTKKIPGIELNSGALGHGLSVGAGLSIAAKMDKKSYRTYVLMGDGEQGEGSIYEAAMSASHYKLDNLIAIIDRNYLQISGNTEDVMSLDSVKDRWKAFGWEVHEAAGNDIETLMNTFDNLSYHNSKPKLIIARTTKGNGISYMENVAKWHHGVPDDEQYALAMKEIEERINSLKDKANHN